jgi:hypothetical protein
MTSRERLLTALRCQQPDRVPVTLFMNPYDPGNPLTADPSYSELLQACREYEDVFYYVGAPLGFLLTAYPVETRTTQLPSGDTEHRVETPRGPLTAIYRSGARGELKRWITEPADVEKWLSLPYVPPTVDHAPLREARQRLGDEVLTQVTMTDPSCCTAWIAEETVALWTLEERGLLRDFYDECFRRHRDQVLQVLDGPAEVIYFNGPEYCLPPLMSPRDFEEFVCHYDRQLFALIRERSDKLIIVHSHGKVRQFLTQFRDTGLHGLNVLEPPPMGDVILAEAKALIGDTVCLIGNLQWSELVTATPDGVRRLVREAMEQGKPGGGFILSPTAMPYESPLSPQTERSLLLYLQYAREYGGY